jgi:hypothetical protein
MLFKLTEQLLRRDDPIMPPYITKENDHNCNITNVVGINLSRLGVFVKARRIHLVILKMKGILMNVANDQSNNLILAELAIKGMNYLCPNCKEIVVLAGGGTQQVHFRHKIGGKYETCQLFVKALESEDNINQKEIYEDNNILFINGMTNIVEGDDYTILSYQIEDLKRNKIPFLRFCNLNQDDVKRFSMEEISEYIKGKGLKYKALWKMCNYQSIEKKIFKVKNLDVDINAAIDAGFGVLELHKGIYAGQKFMFGFGSLSDGDDDFNIGLRLYLNSVSNY